MTSLSNTLFLTLFLTFSLGLYLIATLLDFMKFHAAQKLTILKTGILILALAPFVYLALQALAFKSVEVKMPNLYIDPSTVAPRVLPPMPEKVYWPFYVSLIYGLGIAIVVMQFIRNFMGTRKWLSDSVPANLHGQAVRLSSRISSPLSFGFFSPQIYFPQGVLREWTEREIQLGLSHEQNHILRNDPLWKLISLFVRSLLFFAPWMYVLHQKLELEMEILCDETTCAKTQASTQEYGSLLLALTCKVEPTNLLVTNITDSTIKRRIVAMKSRKIQRPIFATLLSAVMVLAGTAAIATTSGINEKKSYYKISSVILVDGKVVARPRIKTYADETVTITQDGDSDSWMKMKLVASDVSMPKAENMIGLNFDIDYRSGGRTGHAAPQLIVMPKEDGIVQLSGDNGQVFELRIHAERL